MDKQALTNTFNQLIGKTVNVLEGKRKTSIDRNDPVFYQIQSLAKEFRLQVRLIVPGMMIKSINYQDPYQTTVPCMEISIDKETDQRYKVQNCTFKPRTI